MGKRICVVTSDAPFVEGGHLVIARELVRKLCEFGYEAELIRTPQNPFGRQLGAYLATALTDLGEGGDGKPIDGVVSLRFPSFAVSHPRHACWLNHRMREYYDLWPSFRSGLSWKGRIKEVARRFIIHRLDEHCLDHRVRKLYAQSGTIKARLSAWGGHACEVLYPPAVDRPYRNDGYGDFFFAVSRLVPLKRMDLVVRAAALAGARCVVAGEGPEEENLRRLAAEPGAGELITFAGRIGDSELLDYYARCRAVVFPPFNEDYGLVTLEAFSSAKPVITCTDSGGPTELVVNGRNGFVVEPRAEDLAEAMGALIRDEKKATEMGRAALEEAALHSWRDVVARLVEW